MNNKKINKGIFTGLAAITLFAPMVLHSTQVNADNNSELKTVFNSKNHITDIHFNRNVDSTSGNTQDITTNNIKDDFNYDFHDIDQVSLEDGTKLNLSSSQFNNKKELARAINVQVKNHANADEIKPLLGRYHIKTIHTKDGKNITSETPDNTRYDLNDIDYIIFGNNTKMNLSSNHQYYRVIDLAKDINTQIQNKEQTNTNAQAKDSIQANELKSILKNSKNHIKSIHFNKNVDSTSGNTQDITTNNIKDDFNYDFHDIDQVSLEDGTKLNLSSSQFNNKKELARAINVQVKNHANADEIKPLLGRYHIKTIHTKDGKNITSETPDNTRYDLNDIDYIIFGNNTKMNLSSNHQYYRVIDLAKDINTQIQNKEQTNTNAQAKDSIQANELKSILKNSNNHVESIHFNKNVDSTNGNKQDITTNNIKDGSSYNPHDIDQVSFSNHRGNFKLNGANSVDDLNQKIIKLYNQKSNNDKNNNNIVPVTTSGNINSNSNNSHYTKPQMNDGSKEASFPTAPKASTNKHAKHSKKISAKQLKKNKDSVKKNQKHLKAVKRALRKAKGKARKAKLNKQLKLAKKAFAKSEKKLDHAIHSAK